MSVGDQSQGVNPPTWYNKIEVDGKNNSIEMYRDQNSKRPSVCDQIKSIDPIPINAF